MLTNSLSFFNRKENKGAIVTFNVVRISCCVFTLVKLLSFQVLFPISTRLEWSRSLKYSRWHRSWKRKEWNHQAFFPALCFSTDRKGHMWVSCLSQSSSGLQLLYFQGVQITHRIELKLLSPSQICKHQCTPV